MLPEQLRLTDGTIVRRCPTDKPLYCSRAGKFYSVHGMAITDEGCVMHEVRPSFSPVRRKRWRSSNGISGTQYPVMRHFDCMNCHTLIALTWIGERPQGYEIDHINGDRCNYSADNLQYVTPAENRKRARLLRVLRSIGRDPKQMSREELLEIFNKYEFVNPQNLD